MHDECRHPPAKPVFQSSAQPRDATIAPAAKRCLLVPEFLLGHPRSREAPPRDFHAPWTLLTGRARVPCWDSRPPEAPAGSASAAEHAERRGAATGVNTAWNAR